MGDQPEWEGACVPRTVRDLVKLVEADGWEQVQQVGSHRRYKHPAKKGRVTISGSSARMCIRRPNGAS